MKQPYTGASSARAYFGAGLCLRERRTAGVVGGAPRSGLRRRLLDLGPAKAWREGRQLVVEVPRPQGVHNGRAVVEHGYGALALQPLVGFDTTVHFVGIFHFDVARVWPCSPPFLFTSLR